MRVFEKASGGGGTREGWELGPRAWAEAADVGFPGEGGLADWLNPEARPAEYPPQPLPVGDFPSQWVSA